MDLRELPSHALARHPWRTTRAQFFMRVLRDHVRDHVRDESVSIVDFGSGDGIFARRLLEDWPAVSKVVVFDPAYPAERAESQAPRLSFTRDKPGDPCDVLLLLDVLEHDADDRALGIPELSTWLLARKK